MKRKKAIFIVLAVVCIVGIAAGIAGWLAYHKTRPSLSGVQADISLTARKLYKDFSSNEDSADKIYLNKVIEVRGKVSAIQKDTSGIFIELQAGETSMGGINCAMRDTDDLPEKGSIVSIKGRCTGYLMDVSLVDAVKTK